MAVQTWQSRNCTVTLDEATGAVRVSGRGMMEYQNPQPWEEAKALFKSLIIEDGVTNIATHAFKGCTELTGNLTFPDSITTIGIGAFEGCTGLTGGLTIPRAVTEIGSRAFEGCSGFVGDLTLPESVTMIIQYAFSGCSGIDRVLNFAKEQAVLVGVFDAFKGSARFYGYPENTSFRTAAGNRWRDIAEILPRIVTLADKASCDLYPRTKGEAVYLDSGKTLEAALGGLSFWRGTQAEYNALSPKPDKTVYCIIGGSVIVT